MKPTATGAALDASDDYIVVLTDKVITPLKVYQKYLDSADVWRALAEHNLLGKDVRIRLPKEMLKGDQIPAKITKFSGRVEIATDEAFNQLVEEAWLEGANADLMNLHVDSLEPGTYFWRVSTVDTAGYESNWSKAQYFVYPLKLQ